MWQFNQKPVYVLIGSFLALKHYRAILNFALSRSLSQSTFQRASLQQAFLVVWCGVVLFLFSFFLDNIFLQIKLTKVSLTVTVLRNTFWEQGPCNTLLTIRRQINFFIVFGSFSYMYLFPD